MTLENQSDQQTVEQQLRTFSAAVRRPRLPAGDVAYTVDDTGLGRILFAVRPGGDVVATAFVGDDAAEQALLARLAARVSPRVLRSPASTDLVRAQLDEYLAGRRHGFDLTLDLALAADFQREVLAALPRLAGYGRRTTYGALAASTGRPRASRAVGTALGSNPLCVLLPCHRVVAAGGALTGYAGGLDAKRRLLDLEELTDPA